MSPLLKTLRKPCERAAPRPVAQWGRRPAGHAGEEVSRNKRADAGGKLFPIRRSPARAFGGPHLRPPGLLHIPTGFPPLPLRSPGLLPFALSNSRSSFSNRTKTADTKKQCPPFPALLTPQHLHPAAASQNTSLRRQHLRHGESSFSLLHPSSVNARCSVALLRPGSSAQSRHQMFI